MKTVEQAGLVIDTLINNAGLLGDTGPFDQENAERILSMLQVNISLNRINAFCVTGDDGAQSRQK